MYLWFSCVYLQHSLWKDLHRMPNYLRFLEDFILPALNECRYGDLLKWDPTEPNVFLLKWMHKGGTTWREKYTVVFQGWDMLKGHYRPDEPKYFCQSKQRFRSALYKLDQFEELPSVAVNSKCYFKRYRIKKASTYKTKKPRKNSQSLQRVPCTDTGLIQSLPTQFILELESARVVQAGAVDTNQFGNVLLGNNNNAIAEQFQRILVGPQLNPSHPVEIIPNVRETSAQSRRTDRENQENLTPLQNMEAVNPSIDDSYLNVNMSLNELLYMTFPSSPYGVDLNYESDEGMMGDVQQ